MRLRLAFAATRLDARLRDLLDDPDADQVC